MTLIKILLRLVILLAVLFLSASLLQFGSFLYLEHKDHAVKKADLIVVFPGGDDRILTALTLAKNGFGDRLLIINMNTDRQLKMLAARYEITTDITLIPSGKSRSTFEDAYITKETMQQHDYASIILVTSSYHMPRALFLLKSQILIADLDVDLQFHPVQVHENTTVLNRLRLNYNELIKVWGSTVEMVGNLLTGSLLFDSPYFNSASEFIHRHLIF